MHFYSEWSIMKLIPIDMKGFINSCINMIEAVFNMGVFNTNVYKERQDI